MRKNKTTKSALISSVISLFLCVAMLVGTTFAWFTDSVTSANNVIKSGNLDVEFEYWKDGEWVDVAGKSDILTNELWEPGVTEVAYLRVANAGSLALKYQLGINIVKETPGVNMAGETFKLSDFIDFGVKAISADADKKPVTYATREAAVAAVEALDADDLGAVKKISAGYMKAATMKAEEELYLALVVYMPTSVDNRANHNGTDVPSIELGLNIIATQTEAELDSFGADYDKDAWADGMKVYTPDDLQDAINNAEPGVEIVLMDDMKVEEPIVIPAAATTYSARPSATVLNLNGKTITTAYNAETQKHNYAIDNYGNVVINGGTIEARGIYNREGATMEVNKTKIVNLDMNGGSCIWSYGGSVVLNDAELVGYTGCVYSEGYLEINGGTYTCYSGVTDDGVQITPTYNIRSIGELVINDGDFTSRHGLVAVKSNAVINGGTYTMTSIGVITSHVFYIYGEGANLEVNGGEFNCDLRTAQANGSSMVCIDATDVTVSVNGGIYNLTPEKYVADGLKAVNVNGLYYVVPSDITLAYDASSLADAIKNGGKVLVLNDITVDADNTMTVANGVNVTLDLNGYTISGKSTATGKNYQLFDVYGTLTVNGGTVTTEHTGTNMGWNNSTNVFNVVSGGTLTLNETVVKNLGGSDMAYAVNIGNNGGATLTTVAATLESVNYNALRVFNNADGAINVNLTEGTVLTGSGSPVFVHFWSKADLGDKQATRQAYLNLKFNDTEVSRYSGSKSLIRFGFTDAIYYSSTAMDTVVAGNETALKWALANGKNVILNNDIDVSVDTTAPYGNKYGIALNGGVIDGNGYALNFNAYYGDHYGIMTSGGTIKNLTITGVFRGIVVMTPVQDVIIDHVTINDEYVCYAINTAEHPTVDGIDIIVTNSTLGGWTSIAGVETVTFSGCTFVQGKYYTNVYGRLVKPYVNAVFENCKFDSKYYIDLSALEADQNVTLKNCTVNNVELTADNWATLVAPESTCGEGQISIELKNGSYLTASNVVDYVIFE